MNPLRQIITLACACAAAAAAPEATVRFANSDALGGSARSITPAHLIWESPLLEQPAKFLLNQVLDVTLTPEVPGQSSDHEAEVTLTNGDSIRGQLSAVTEDAITLDTWYAGRLSFRRPMVSSVKIEQRSPFLYRGPTGLEGWQQSAQPPAWIYQNSAFRASAEGGIARDDLLPEECMVSFDVAWKGDSIRLRVIVFSDEPTTDHPESGYELTFMRGGIHVRNCKTKSFLGSVQSQALMENDKVSVEVRASTKSNRVALAINGRTLEVWTDPDEGEGRFGKALQFISASKQPLRVSQIRVEPWDGTIDKMPEPRPGFNRRFGFPEFEEEEPSDESKPATEERMELANGDSLAGEVSSIQDGIITVRSPLGEIRLPVARLRTVKLKSAEAERSKRYEGDIRAWLPDGSSIVFRLDASSGDTLTGFSQNFGTATFNTAAFRRIEFNIYTPDYEDLRRAEEW
jgi:hypothetical protein